MDTNETSQKVSFEYDDVQPGVSPDEERHGTKRIIQIIVGVCLVIAGIAMLVLPGQGVLAILIGLNMIKPDNAIVRWMRRKVPGIPEEGELPKKVLYFGVVLTVVATVIGILYGPSITSWVLDLVGWG